MFTLKTADGLTAAAVTASGHPNGDSTALFTVAPSNGTGLITTKIISRNKTAVVFVVVATITISSLIRCSSLRRKGLIFNSIYGGMSVKQDNIDVDELTLQIYMHNKRKMLLNESSMINLGMRSAQNDKVQSRFIQDSFPDIEVVESMKGKNISERTSYLNEFASADPSHDLLYGGVCDTLSVFRETKGMRRHVLISHLNENWGAFSTPVENRTINW